MDTKTSFLVLSIILAYKGTMESLNLRPIEQCNTGDIKVGNKKWFSSCVGGANSKRYIICDNMIK